MAGKRKKSKSDDFAIASLDLASPMGDDELNALQNFESSFETDSPDLAEQEKVARTRKESAVLVSFAVSIIGLAAIIFSVVFSFQNSSVIKPVVSNTLKVDIKISDSQFSSATSNAVCAGSGLIAGISNSTIYLSQQSSGLSLNARLGAGTLTSDGNCEYLISLSAPANFKGGKITSFIKFPFGATSPKIDDLGVELPYPTIPWNLTLN
jgi:hypothetical protein